MGLSVLSSEYCSRVTCGIGYSRFKNHCMIASTKPPTCESSMMFENALRSS